VSGPNKKGTSQISLGRALEVLLSCGSVSWFRYEIESSRHTRSYDQAVSMKPFPNRTGVF